MGSLFRLTGALVTAALLSVPALGPMSGQAVAQTTVYAAGDTTSGTYMDYMNWSMPAPATPRSSSCR